MCVRVHSRALLQLIYILGDVPACLNPSPVVERGVNVRPGKVAERCANVSVGAVLDDGYTSGTTTDGFPRVKKCAAEPTAAAEGVIRAGASTAVRDVRCQMCGDARLFCLLNEK